MESPRVLDDSLMLLWMAILAGICPEEMGKAMEEARREEGGATWQNRTTGQRTM